MATKSVPIVERAQFLVSKYTEEDQSFCLSAHVQSWESCKRY